MNVMNDMKIQNRILVVDDDAGVKEAFQNIFAPPEAESWRHAGQTLFTESTTLAGRPETETYELVMVDRGDAAPALIKAGIEEKKPFAVAFVDMKMPGIDGAETARRIWQAAPATKIVIMTAYSEFSTDQISRAAGRNDLFYIRKPFSSDEIRQFARSLTWQWSLERDRDRLAKQLEAANQRLECAVTERTAQLRQAFQKLRALDQTKMTFLRYLSHEMNTALNWVGAACLIDSAALCRDDRNMLHTVEKGFNRLSDLIEAVLAYFELAADDLKLKKERLHLRILIMALLDRRAAAIKKNGIDFKVQIDPERVVTADRAYFQELLETVIDNAIAYSDPGGQVTITGGNRETPFCLSIEDQGKGVDGQHIRRIFEAFAMPAFERHECGCGLNLPRAKLIAEAHGWRIWAESQGPEQGTRIVVADNGCREACFEGNGAVALP